MVVEGSALGHSDLISITRYYPTNGAITYKEHDHHILPGWVGGRSSSRSGRLIVSLQWRCMSKVRSREIWVSDSRTNSDGERNLFYRSVVCSMIDSIRSHC
jgi:hypothetical protein